MAIKQIKDLTNQPSPASGDLLEIQEADGDASRRTTISGLISAVAAEPVEDIAYPETADAQDCAAKINELLDALRTAGIIQSE